MAAVQTAFDFAHAPRPRPAGRRAPRRTGEAAPSTAPASPPAQAREDDAEARRLACELALARRLGTPVELTITDNGRTMLSSRAAAGALRVRAHHMFLDADAEVLDAVVAYLASADADASSTLKRYVKARGERVRRRLRRPARLTSCGRHHDLQAIYADLNQRYFGDAVAAQIGWGRRGHSPGGGRRRSIKLGSYRGRDATIRVHPVLDARWVPRFFVEYIVYHEMLHHVVPMPRRGGRRTLHGPDFTEREQRFEHYARAIAWERANLERLLGS